jgi:hypothetical protein
MGVGPPRELALAAVGGIGADRADLAARMIDAGQGRGVSMLCPGSWTKPPAGSSVRGQFRKHFIAALREVLVVHREATSRGARVASSLLASRTHLPLKGLRELTRR